MKCIKFEIEIKNTYAGKKNSLKQLIKKGDYVGAYRYIFNSFPQISNGWKENRDYYLDPKVWSGIGFQTVEKDRFIRQNGVPFLPSTRIGKDKFDTYLKGGPTYILGDLIKDVFHESIHIKLYKGTLETYPHVLPSIGDGKWMHEVIATYFHLKDNTIPYQMSPTVRNTMASFGALNYSLIKDPLQKQSNYFKKMNTYFIGNH